MSFHKTKLMSSIIKGKFIISIQIDPPRKKELDEFNKMIDDLMAAGVGVVDINSSRSLSHDSIQLAVALAQKGLKAMPHITTRDSSINGLANQIFAAYSWGNVDDFLLIAGDPYEASQAMIPSHGVFQTDSADAIRALNKHLRKDKKLKLNISFAAAVNQNDPDLASEGKRLKEKEAAGTDFFMSQPVFSEEQASGLFDFYHSYSKKPLIVGIWPMVNQRTSDTIRDGRIVGVEIPDKVYEEANLHCGTETDLQNWGLEEAYKLIEFIRLSGEVQGVYIVAPPRNPLLLLGLLEKIIEK